MTDNIPTLYRYFSFQKTAKKNKKILRDLIIKNNLYLSNPSAFNDPFDCFICPIPSQEMFHSLLDKDKALQKRIKDKLRSGEITSSCINKYLPMFIRKNVRSNFSMACFSEDKNNPLMLAHYSSNHEGYFVEYDFSRILNWINENTYGLMKVNYAPKMDGEKIMNPLVNNQSDSENAINYMLLTKASDWSYENEWRLIIKKNGQHNEINWTDSGAIVSFPESAISAVYMAGKISDEHKSLMIDVCKEASIDLYSSSYQDDNFNIYNQRS